MELSYLSQQTRLLEVFFFFFFKKDELLANVPHQDLALPRAVIARVSKGVLPPNAQIQKQALQAISKSATAFVNYISSV